MTLSMKNYKGFEKLPYCGAHVPKVGFFWYCEAHFNMTLCNKNYKGFEKLPYCGAHVPEVGFFGIARHIFIWRRIFDKLYLL